MTELGPEPVRISTGWSMPVSSGDHPDLTGGAQPLRWIGAPATGGLMLPDATPSDQFLYAPRGVWLDDKRLVVADTGNHRVLVWSHPSELDDHAPASVVLGQASFTDEGPQAAGRGPENGMHLPTGIVVAGDGRLVVADAWNHRLLVWNEVPERSDTPPDVVIGQPDANQVDENGGGLCSATTFYWPFGITLIEGRLFVADTGNRRVVVYEGIPEPGDQPAFVLGQPDPASRNENRGELGPGSFRWPHSVAFDGQCLFIADAGNHRVLGWRGVPVEDGPADFVLGQPDFTTAIEVPYSPQSASTLRFPYAIAASDGIMSVADTANNRVLLWDTPVANDRTPADRVLGQHDFATIGENRWDSVAFDTFCWPYGVAMHDGQIAVADSGNNRVMVWTL